VKFARNVCSMHVLMLMSLMLIVPNYFLGVI
jgi:hypothetical protein